MVVNYKGWQSRLDLTQVVESKDGEEEDTDKAIGCSSSGNSVVVAIFQNLDLKKEVGYKDGEEEETDKAIGCSSRHSVVIIAFLDNIDPPSSLHSVQVSPAMWKRLSVRKRFFGHLGITLVSK